MTVALYFLLVQLFAVAAPMTTRSRSWIWSQAKGRNGFFHSQLQVIGEIFARDFVHVILSAERTKFNISSIWRECTYTTLDKKKKEPSPRFAARRTMFDLVTSCSMTHDQRRAKSSATVRNFRPALIVRHRAESHDGTAFFSPDCSSFLPRVVRIWHYSLL